MTLWQYREAAWWWTNERAWSPAWLTEPGFRTFAWFMERVEWEGGESEWLNWALANNICLRETASLIRW